MKKILVIALSVANSMYCADLTNDLNSLKLNLESLLSQLPAKEAPLEQGQEGSEDEVSKQRHFRQSRLESLKKDLENYKALEGEAFGSMEDAIRKTEEEIKQLEESLGRTL